MGGTLARYASLIRQPAIPPAQWKARLPRAILTPHTKASKRGRPNLWHPPACEKKPVAGAGQAPLWNQKSPAHHSLPVHRASIMLED